MRHLLLTTALLGSFGMIAMPAHAEMSKADIEKIIHEYIMNNPQVMIDSVNAYEANAQDEQQKQAMAVVKESADWIYKNPDHGTAGNPKGDITIVEFFDYNCGYCKQALNDVMTIIEEDKNVKVIFIDMPILGESSHLAARWSKAAQEQGKFVEFHIPLMKHRGAINESVLENYATAAGMDLPKARAFISSSQANSKISENLTKSREFGLTGTPAFILGDNLVRGYVGLDGLRRIITDTRAIKK